MGLDLWPHTENCCCSFCDLFGVEVGRKLATVLLVLGKKNRIPSMRFGGIVFAKIVVLTIHTDYRLATDVSLDARRIGLRPSHEVNPFTLSPIPNVY